MKRIWLKSLPDPKNPYDENNRVDYRSLIEQAIRVPLDRQTGATIDEMRKGIRVLDALDETEDDILVLEDADWDFLKQKVEHFPWGMVDRRLLQFNDDIVGATAEEPARIDGKAAF